MLGPGDFDKRVGKGAPTCSTVTVNKPYDKYLTWYGVQTAGELTDGIVDINMYKKNFRAILEYAKKSKMDYKGILLHLDPPSIAKCGIQPYSSYIDEMALLVASVPIDMRVGFHIVVEQDSTWELSYPPVPGATNTLVTATQCNVSKTCAAVPGNHTCAGVAGGSSGKPISPPAMSPSGTCSKTTPSTITRSPNAFCPGTASCPDKCWYNEYPASLLPKIHVMPSDCNANCGFCPCATADSGGTKTPAQCIAHEYASVGLQSVAGCAACPQNPYLSLGTSPNSPTACWYDEGYNDSWGCPKVKETAAGLACASTLATAWQAGAGTGGNGKGGGTNPGNPSGLSPTAVAACILSQGYGSMGLEPVLPNAKYAPTAGCTACPANPWLSLGTGPKDATKCWYSSYIDTDTGCPHFAQTDAQIVCAPSIDASWAAKPNGNVSATCPYPIPWTPWGAAMPCGATPPPACTVTNNDALAPNACWYISSGTLITTLAGYPMGFDPLSLQNSIFYGGPQPSAKPPTTTLASGVNPMTGSPYQNFGQDSIGYAVCPYKATGTSGPKGTPEFPDGCVGNMSRAGWYVAYINARLRQLGSPQRISMTNWDSEGNGPTGLACSIFQFLFALRQFGSVDDVLPYIPHVAGQPVGPPQPWLLFMNGGSGLTSTPSKPGGEPCGGWAQVPINVGTIGNPLATVPLGAGQPATYGDMASFRAAPEFYWMGDGGVSSDLGNATCLLPSLVDAGYIGCPQSAPKAPLSITGPDGKQDWLIYDQACGCKRTVYKTYGSVDEGGVGLLGVLAPIYDALNGGKVGPGTIATITPAFSIEHLGDPDDPMDTPKCLNAINFCTGENGAACAADNKCIVRCGVMGAFGSWSEGCFQSFLDAFANRYNAESVMVYDAGFLPQSWLPEGYNQVSPALACSPALVAPACPAGTRAQGALSASGAPISPPGSPRNWVPCACPPVGATLLPPMPPCAAAGAVDPVNPGTTPAMAARQQRLADRPTTARRYGSRP